MGSLNEFLFTLIYQGVGYWPLLDRFFIVLTSYIAYAVVAMMFVYMAIVVPSRAKEASVRLKRIVQGAEVALSLFVTWVIVWALKVIIAHPRPFMTLDDVAPLVSASPLESFPSSHAALTMALAIAVLPFRKHLGHLLIAFAFVVSLSRLYVGVHYPFDVGVGLLLGFVIAKLIHRVFREKQGK